MHTVLLPEICAYTTRDYDVTIKPWCDHVIIVAFLLDDDYHRYCSQWADIILTEV